MKSSTDRILTTHVGSLPRPPSLVDLLDAQDKGRDYDAAAFEQEVTAAVRDVVTKQVDAGIDIVCDGEMSKVGYTFYVRHRLSGIEAVGGRGTPPSATPRDLLDHPEINAAREKTGSGPTRLAALHCVGAVAYRDRGPLDRDIERLHTAVAEVTPVEAFMNAASPGVLPNFIPDDHYGDEDAYVADLADAMKSEYEAIHAAGFILQIDCPDLAMMRHMVYQDRSDDEFLRIVERNVEAINHATANIPPEAVRMHLCWGNYAGPHTHDFPVAKIADRVMTARPQAILFEGANPRHEHEWEDWKAAGVPDDKILIPGVIDSTTNFVEHPRLVAQRICHYAAIVGRERVIAGTDCGLWNLRRWQLCLPVDQLGTSSPPSRRARGWRRSGSGTNAGSHPGTRPSPNAPERPGS